MNTKKNILASTIAFFVGAAGAQISVAESQVGGGKANSWVLEEIVVTASKRSQSLQDTAMSVSALSGESIDKRGLVGMDDYLRTLPGVSMQDRGASQNSVVVRGIAANPQGEKEAVGIYFGDTPVTGLGSAGLTGRSGSADIKLVDIDRVEVLRGPQGTLYGAGSMGGTVRVIPTAPSLDQIDGKLAVRYSHTDEEGGDNNMVQGVVNIPLIEDELAVRAVVYQFENSGFIKNVSSSVSAPSLAGPISLGGKSRDQDNIGKDEYTGVRLGALWRQDESLSIALNYTHQDIEQIGMPEVNGNLPDNFQQVRLGVGSDGNQSELMSNNVDITNLVIEYNLGWASLLSSSSLIDYEAKNDMDFSHGLGLPMYIKSSQDTDVFIEELRLVSQLDGPIQFIAGVYYEDIDSETTTPILWTGDASLDDPVTVLGVPALSVFDTFDTDTFDGESTQQTAFFAEISYLVTELLEVTVGGRTFEYDQELTSSSDGFLVGGSSASIAKNSDSDQSLKMNISFTPSDTMLVYGQWAEGFRLGSPKPELTVSCDGDNDGLIDGLGVAPVAIEPDELESFELGIKSSFFNSRVNLNVAFYHINWEGIPVVIIAPCQSGFAFNAGKSKSQGIEIETQASVTDSLQLNFSASYGEATLKEDIPNASGFGTKGDNLPGSSDYNVSLGIEYDFTLAGYDAFVRGDYAYVDEYYHNFEETGQASGGYGQVNLKTGLSVDQIKLDVFLNNLTNEDSFTWVETVFGGQGFNRGYRLRPRTIGLNIEYTF